MFRDFLQQRIWTFTAGIALAMAAFAWLGKNTVWYLLFAGVAAGLLQYFFHARTSLGNLPERSADNALTVLPPQTQLLFEQLPMPVLLLDAGERVLFVNQRMRELLGSGLEHKHISAVLRNPDVLTAIDDAMQGRQANVPFTLPVPIERHFQAYAARIQVAPTIAALLLHDLTAIRRSEQMREDFIANVSHELRTPLAAVSGFIDTLRGHAKDDEVAREQFLEIMMVEAARMRRLIDDLLSLTRIEMNEHVPPEGRIQLDSLVREVVAALMPLTRADHITIEIAGTADQPAVLGDRDELIQLFQNLIHNAIKYSRDNGHVWISSGLAPDGQVFVTVRDDGEGIPSSAVPRLTERFYRVDIKRSREKGGTGLGLAIVKHIVNRHGGRLQIESRQGEGSSFTVLMPSAAAKNGQKPPSAGPAPLGVMEML